MVNKEVREIAKRLEKQGWWIQHIKGGRVLAWPPDKTKNAVKLPSTPGGRRWKENLTAELRKAGADL